MKNLILKDKGLIMIKNFKTKKPKYKDLALRLGVSEQAVKQYPKEKRLLMILGLWLENETKYDELNS